MLGVLAKAISFMNCHLDDVISVGDIVVLALPETDRLLPPKPPQIWRQVLVRDTKLRINSHRDLFQLEDSSFTYAASVKKMFVFRQSALLALDAPSTWLVQL